MSWVLALGLAVWALATVVEALIAAAMGRFLARARPDLLPSGAPAGARERPAA